MRHRLRQVGFTVALSLPLLWAALNAPPFVSQPVAQARQRYLGPNFPALVTNNSKPTEGRDESIVPTFSGNTVSFKSRWNCNGNTFNAALSNTDAQGRYQTATRTNARNIQSVSRKSASSVDYSETVPGFGSVASGVGSLVDANGDGIFEGANGTGSTQKGGAVTVSFSFMYADVTGDGFPDYITAPTSWITPQPGGCGPPVPVWIPLADTNGDNIPDSIVLDLNGDGVPDPQFFTSPKLGPPPGVPAINIPGLLILLAVLGGLGVWSLKRNQGRLAF